MDKSAIVNALIVEREIRRRAQRMWRVFSVVAGVAAGGFVAWWLGLALFAVFQFLAYATYWHSVRQMEAETGLTEGQQLAILEQADLQRP